MVELQVLVVVLAVAVELQYITLMILQLLQSLHMVAHPAHGLVEQALYI